MRNSERLQSDTETGGLKRFNSGAAQTFFLIRKFWKFSLKFNLLGQYWSNSANFQGRLYIVKKRAGATNWLLLMNSTVSLTEMQVNLG